MTRDVLTNTTYFHLTNNGIVYFLSISSAYLWQKSSDDGGGKLLIGVTVIITFVTFEDFVQENCIQMNE